MLKADLHLHTTCSDGEYSPQGAVKAAAEAGFQLMAVTDHDTIVGIEEALRAGEKAGITVIPGVEVTLRFKRPRFTGSLHVLLYFTEELFRNAAFQRDIMSTVSRGRGPGLVKSRVKAINDVFGPRGSTPLLKRELTADEILSLAPNVSRRHFAQALAANHDLSRDQVSRLIGNDSPAYIPSGIEMESLAKFISRYPVLPVLAHPAAGSYPGESHYSEVLPSLEVVEGMLPEFLAMGLRGLEVYYPGHTDEHVQHLLALAKKLGLVVTGGSDCHDAEKRPLLQPGAVGDVSEFLELLKTLE